MLPPLTQTVMMFAGYFGEKRKTLGTEFSLAAKLTKATRLVAGMCRWRCIFPLPRLFYAFERHSVWLPRFTNWSCCIAIPIVAPLVAVDGLEDHGYGGKLGDFSNGSWAGYEPSRDEKNAKQKASRRPPSPECFYLPSSSSHLTVSSTTASWAFRTDDRAHAHARCLAVHREPRGRRRRDVCPTRQLRCKG